jgi:outer membrane receptor for ferrienterochelin and colicin
MPRSSRSSVAALAVALVLAGSVDVGAQLQQGTIQGVVLAPDGAPADAAVITLLDPLGARLLTTSATRGVFTLTNVAPGTYAVHAEAPPLQATVQQVVVTSALPVRVQLRLSAVASEQVVVQGHESQPTATTTRVTLGGDAVRRAPARLRSRGVQDAIATVPGWATEDNGLLHVRGVDDGFLYVIDGVPVYERLDGAFGMAPDPAMIDSLNVVTGYIPPEFGWKAGGVIEIRSAARTDGPWSGAVDLTAGADRTRDASLVAGGQATRQTSITMGLARQSSARFLDPVHPDNLHNDGSAWSGGGQIGWVPSSIDTVNAVAGFGRSHFDVPHGRDQEDADQDQRQRIGQYWGSLSWQRAWTSRTVSQVSGYNRFASSRLTGSDRDVPLFVEADRTLGRAGFIASVSHQRGRHLFKAGAEAAWLRLDEAFSFAVTDPDEAEEAELSEEALEHTLDDPFRFNGSASRPLYSLYIQDSFRVSDALTIDAGLRADWSRLLTHASQVSPRVGAAYRWEAASTTVRASFARFFQPPQAENLLLSSSEEARELSPFVEETGGGAPLEPERQTVFELGVDRTFARTLRLDVSVWRRWMTNVADPNVFFGTTILFPNSVAEGRASGLDVRLEVPRRRGWSGYLSYANSRVVQYGPISGGLFLEENVIDIGPGTAFTPDHDQRNVGAFGVSYDGDAPGFWAAVTGRYESGTPLEVGDDAVEDLRERPGAELVDFERGRVKPRAVFDATVSKRVMKRGGVELSLRAGILNVTGRRWAYNFGNPFSGTHFGPGRTAQLGARLVFR